MVKIEVQKSHFYIALSMIGIVLMGTLYFSSFITNAPRLSVADKPESLEVRFSLLSGAKTNACSGPGFIAGKQNGDRLQGSCCGPMDFHRYQEQVEGLKKYSHISKIPPDPYDIPVALANELLEYQKTLKLTPEQQEIYDEAMTLSGEGGPCCCKCWRWYAFEGLAKHLIIEYDFSAEQIAEVWDLEDGCGGSGHMHT